MMPSPPSQTVYCRHMAIDRDTPSTSVSTLELVVENPDMDSKKASIGRESWGSTSRYGRAPKTAISSHTSATTR